MSINRVGILLLMFYSLAYAGTELTADELECDQQTGLCTAKGNVRVITEEGDDMRILMAEQVVAHMNKDATGRTTFDEVNAKGSINLKSKGGDVRSEEATYYPETQKAKFFKKVKVWQNKSWLEGDFAEADLKIGKFNIRGEGKQVNGLFYPQD